MRKLLAGEPIPMKSKLTPLNVFLDESNIIRVGGRLANSNLNEKAKFPMILPSRNVLTDIILSHYHKKYLHAGPHSLLYLVRQKFWPLNGRNNCRRIIHECVNCFKNKPITMNQIMANLPRDRVTPNYPFNVTGVDFVQAHSSLSLKIKDENLPSTKWSTGRITEIFPGTDVEEGERKVDVAKAFEIPLSSLSTILKNKEKIFIASSSRVRKRVSKGKFPRLEQCLVSWMRQCRGQKIPMGSSLLKEKAKAFTKELGIEFSATEDDLQILRKGMG
ncbi:pro-Pol polyprotein [Trichonephila clavipes]|nr:pro-Pol polyprotein [Trichonephila clavipes]